MKNASEYGDIWADIYDEYMSDRLVESDPAVEFLLKRSGVGPMLELGTGTGRLALPLVGKGAIVHGIEASAAMISKFRAKPGSNSVVIQQADYSEFETTAQYPLIFAPFNAVMMLPERSDQLACFRSVTRALLAGGRFVVEAELPDLSGFANGMRVHLSRMTDTSVELRINQHRRMEQQLAAQHIWLRNGSIEMRPLINRYAAPSELDLMAELAGLTLEARYGDWSEEAFTPDSRRHVSVYQRR